ncbi:SDR family NAD(P)-dependent oxidoreductase [Candidatus Desantisbacteria bacterium]|nr:SDR family NAD(P)-dependent oxidoreductase [Candidatus Desantisbacteria bacterium]
MDKNKDFNEKVTDCISVLESLVNNSDQIGSIPKQQLIALMTFAGKLSRPDKDEIRKRERARKQIERQKIVNHERAARASTGIRVARESKVFSLPAQITDAGLDENYSELKSPRNCYICKKEFTRLHFFYDSMCPQCAELNYKKRFQTASLHGQVALITGSRLKIGYQAALMMLRAGAKVIATTRFPVDSALRFSREKDFSSWADRLHIYGLDLRHTPSIEIFCRFIEQKYDRLDLLINNAAQTVRRPPGFYAHLIPGEMKELRELPETAQRLLKFYEECKKQLKLYSKSNITADGAALAINWDDKTPGIGLRCPAYLSQIPYECDRVLSSEEIFPKDKLDADLQQVDLRETNSWRLRLGEIQTSEMFEIQLVNAIAPFVLCNKLIPMMRRDNTGKKHIVNVTAVEGKFYRFKKGDRHPHTNMAKAALNMLTHTSASGLTKDGIFMNAVDTGWVTDEDPAALSARKQEIHDFQPPLDIVDGAARVCDPFFHGILTGKHWCGKFLKDYFPIDW